uniref:CLIP-associating protein 2-like isoform X3 n=1 Tax=Myxine glutinosa TaxID=7769 RepID=UPI00358FB165
MRPAPGDARAMQPYLKRAPSPASKGLNADKAQEEQEVVEAGQDTHSNNGMTKPSAGKRSPNAGTSRKPGGTRTSTAKEGAGALDEEDFIRAFEEVSPVHVHSPRELEDLMNKIRDVLSDEKQDWEQRVAALKRLRGLLLGGAVQIDGFQQHLRLLENALKLSVKDLRSQVVREACIATAYLSSLLKNKFDHMAEVLLQSLFNLVPNSARIMASSGVVTLRLVIRHTHASRLIPIITSNSTSKAVALRRRSFECLEQLLQEWPTAPLERHGSTLSGAVKRGISDADSEARMVARKCYWGLHNQLPSVARTLYSSLEQSYQKALQNARGPANGVSLLPHSDRSSSSSQESLNRQFGRRRMGAQTAAAAISKKSGSPRKSAPTPGVMQRSRSDVDVGAASSAKARVSDFPGGPTSPAKKSGSNSNLNRLQRRPISTLLTKGEGRSRKPARMIQPPSHRSRSSSPGSILTGSPIRSRGYHSPTIAIAALAAATPTRPRSKIPRSVGSSRETSPTRGCSARGSQIPRPSLSQTCSRDTSRESSRDASPIRGFSSIVWGPSRIPRPSLSQGCSRNTSRDSSRDASPIRVYTTMGTRQHSRSTSALTSAGVFGLPDTYLLGQSRGLSSSVNAMRLLDSGSDVEAAVADALRRPVRRRYDMYGMGSDDDANSDASSACSERSHGSRNGPSPLYLRHTEDVAEILNRCSSSSWAERKEGLLGLQALFKGHRTLSRVELKRLCEIFTRMFGDPHSKVFSMFLETLVDFLQTHKSELNDWLFVLLTQLLRKMGADLLGSVHAKAQRALDVTRESFPTDHQFNILMRFVVDQTQVLNLKVKVAVLKYICSLTRQMELHEFVNASETRLAVSRIITWTTEPKSSEVRKAAQAVLVALFELNPSEFTMLLGALPKTFQDGATRLLHTHLKAPGKTNAMSSGGPLRGPIRSPASRGSPVTSPSASASSQCTSSPGEGDGEPSEDFYRSLRGVSQAIQSFSFRSQEDLTDSGTSRQSTGEQTKPPTSTEGPLFTPDPTGQPAAPPPITELLRVLSEGSARSEERRSALRELLKAAREEQAAAWEEHFKTALLLLLETLKDADGSVRSLTLRVLSEILRSQPACFRKYAELTIMKVLEAHRDPQKEVVRAAEETAGSLAASLPPEQSLKVLCPVVQTADFPINLAAIKMETRVVERLSPPILHTLLPSIIPGLLQGYDNAESSVRKACVFCLVAIHSAIGDELNPFLAHLSGSKIKLLNLYIKRAESSIPSSNAGLPGH